MSDSVSTKESEFSTTSNCMWLKGDNSRVTLSNGTFARAIVLSLQEGLNVSGFDQKKRSYLCNGSSRGGDIFYAQSIDQSDQSLPNLFTVANFSACFEKLVSFQNISLVLIFVIILLAFFGSIFSCGQNYMIW